MWAESAHRVAFIPQHSVQAALSTARIAIYWRSAMADRRGVLRFALAPPVCVYTPCDALPDRGFLLTLQSSMLLFLLQ